MSTSFYHHLSKKAIEVLQLASSQYGIKATPEKTDNYNRIWARDSAVSAIAIITNQLESLYPTVEVSLKKLQEAAYKNGQIPSNVSTSEQGEITGVSFGGPVGRTDAGFWWVIAAVLYLEQQPNNVFKHLVAEQAHQIFELANSWEFNHKGLMYLPMSSNWADEYVTHGYVLYDQILLYWALQLAAKFFNNNEYAAKAQQMKIAIKQHFLFEAELQGSLYTQKQQQDLQDFNIGKKFIASFSPGDRVERYDAWSIALLLLLQIPSATTTKQLIEVLDKTLQSQNNIGIPAFFPVIESNDLLFAQLQNNHHYRFKNLPGHFHNGGIWPVVNGFLIAGLMAVNELPLATKLLASLQEQLNGSIDSHPFAEYFTSNGKANGVANLCYSAAGYLLAAESTNNYQQFSKLLHISTQEKENALQQQVENVAQQIIQQLKIEPNTITAISVAGESGSGKTTLGKALHKALQQQAYNVLLLHQDDYFVLPPKKNHTNRLENFEQIGIAEVRLHLLDEHINEIKSKQQSFITAPIMDWLNDKEEKQTINTTNTQVILIDGTYTSLLEKVDYKIFINTNYKETKENRINRNRETVTDFIEKVLEKESSIIQSHLSLADIVVNKDLQIVKSIV